MTRLRKFHQRAAATGECGASATPDWMSLSPPGLGNPPGSYAISPTSPPGLMGGGALLLASDTTTQDPSETGTHRHNSTHSDTHSHTSSLRYTRHKEGEEGGVVGQRLKLIGLRAHEHGVTGLWGGGSGDRRE